MDESDYFIRLLEETACNAKRQHEAAMTKLVQDQEYALFAQLKPDLFIDGNQWCVLYGENLQEGIAGFGDTPQKAIWDWNKQFERPVAPPLRDR